MNCSAIAVPFSRTLSHFYKTILARNKYSVKSHLGILAIEAWATGNLLRVKKLVGSHRQVPQNPAIAAKRVDLLRRKKA